jgi:alkylated DNA repair dioxygenase AlkB
MLQGWLKRPGGKSAAADSGPSTAGGGKSGAGGPSAAGGGVKRGTAGLFAAVPHTGPFAKPKKAKRDDETGDPPPSFVDCPVCGTGVPFAALNHHLDANLCKNAKAAALAVNDADLAHAKAPPGAPQGWYLVTDFITEEEEEALVRSIDNDPQQPWRRSVFNGECMSKTWGLVTDLKLRQVSPPDPEKNKFDLPDYLRPVIERMSGPGSPPTAGWFPSEANSNSYLAAKGHHLTAHFDDRSLSGDIIANLSLLGDVTMTLRHGRDSSRTFDAFLPRRSLQVLTRDARFVWTHEIAKSNVHSERRVSITFRQPKLTQINKARHSKPSDY